jgi:hypothetical protein
MCCCVRGQLGNCFFFVFVLTGITMNEEIGYRLEGWDFFLGGGTSVWLI